MSNIGITPDLSAIYTTNSAMDTAFVQVSLKEDHTHRQLRIHGAGPTNARIAKCLNSPPIFKPADS